MLSLVRFHANIRALKTEILGLLPDYIYLPHLLSIFNLEIAKIAVTSKSVHFLVITNRTFNASKS